MPCACCETGRCCNGATCTAGGTTSACASNGGSFTAGGDCNASACTSLSQACTVQNYCACLNAGKTPRAGFTTCNCATLSAGGVPYGGCANDLCQVCNSSTGNCVNDCPYPRACCIGTCCPESQQCNSTYCVNRCSSGTYCNTTSGVSFTYSCCGSTQKCCGPSGCQAYTYLGGGSASLSSDKPPGGDGWLDTMATYSAGVTITITAYGTGTTNGVATDPAGITSNCTASSRYSTAFCYNALIGKVGSSGTPFLIGASYSGEPGGGVLYLRVNRTDFATGASEGGRLEITYSGKADPCPGYYPAAIGEPIVYAAGEEPPKPLPGPGSALKSLLRLVGIVASPTCSCNARAAQMDTWGEWECLKRLPEICGWLKEEAEKRELWFFPPAGWALIVAAISLSALKRPFRGNNR